MLFVAENYTAITFNDFIRWQRGEGQIPENSIILTFDDGFRDNYHHAIPILQKLGLKSTFFIIGQPVISKDAPWLHAMYELVDQNPLTELTDALRGSCDVFPDFEISSKAQIVRWIREDFHSGHTSRIDRHTLLRVLHEALYGSTRVDTQLFMTADQISAIHKLGFEIGCHSMAHEYLSRLTDTELHADIENSCEVITSVIQEKPRVFCYPFGHSESWNDRSVSSLKMHGFDCACSTRSGVNDKETDPFALRRIDVSGDIDFSTFVFRISGLESKLKSYAKKFF